MFLRFLLIFIVSMVILAHCDDGEKPGTCPKNQPNMMGICIGGCSNDYDCTDNLKCCPNPCGGGQCVKSVEASQAEKKSGTCPPVDLESSEDCITTCDGDSSCPGDQVCCMNACGGFSCVEPM